MKIKLITVGKTEDDYIKEGVLIYQNRLKHYVNFENIELPAIKTGKKLNTLLQKEKEGQEILKLVAKGEFVILLDEKGKEVDSNGFAQLIQKRMNTGMDLVFVIGGPFGFSSDVYNRSDMKLALSQLTFSHQMVRLFFVEQLYRGFTILKGENYHHN